MIRENRNEIIVHRGHIQHFSIPIFNYISFNLLNVLLISLCLPLSCCTFWSPCLYTAMLCFCLSGLCHYSPVLLWLFLVLHSGHKIFLFSFSNIFFPTTISFLPYFVYLTLVSFLISTLLFLHFYASRQLLYHTFIMLEYQVSH